MKEATQEIHQITSEGKVGLELQFFEVDRQVLDAKQVHLAREKLNHHKGELLTDFSGCALGIDESIARLTSYFFREVVSAGSLVDVNDIKNRLLTNALLSGKYN